MRQIIKKVIIGILPIIIGWIYMAQHFFGYMDNEAPNYLWNKRFIYTNHDEYYKTIVLGDSAMNSAIIPDMIQSGTINLALGGTTPIESYLLLKEYLQNNKAPKEIIIGFNEQHMVGEDCFWERIVYTHRFSMDEEKEIFQAGIKYDEPGIIHKGWRWDYFEYKTFCPTKYITSFVNGGINQREKENIEIMDITNNNSGRYIGLTDEGHIAKEKNIYSDTMEYVVSHIMNDYMHKIINLCQDEGIKVHMIKLPKSEEVVYSKKYIQTTREYYDGICIEYGDGVTFDWIEYNYDQEYFVDMAHLNNRGARMVSEVIHDKYY